MKACVECHAGQTLTLNPPLQSGLFVDAYNHMVSSEKKKSLKSLQEEVEEKTLKSERGSNMVG